MSQLAIAQQKRKKKNTEGNAIFLAIKSASLKLQHALFLKMRKYNISDSRVIDFYHSDKRHRCCY